MEKKYRTTTKIILWRLITLSVTITILQIYTNNINISLSLGLIDHTICLIMHYFYERLWSNITWGIYNKDNDTENNSNIETNIV